MFAVVGVILHNMIIYVLSAFLMMFVEHILNSIDTCQNMYEDYVTARINGHVIILAKKMKVGNKMFVSGRKTTVIECRDKMVALNETTDLYGTLVILTKSA